MLSVRNICSSFSSYTRLWRLSIFSLPAFLFVSLFSLFCCVFSLLPIHVVSSFAEVPLPLPLPLPVSDVVEDLSESLDEDSDDNMGEESISEEDLSLLKDWNEDGSINVVAFGDSITYGTGDGNRAGVNLSVVPQVADSVGYPSRVSSVLSLPVLNYGVPGENMIGEGSYRFVRMVKTTRPDLVILSEGSNDAMLRSDPATFARVLQIMINLASAYSTKVVLGTITPSCCLHEGRGYFTSAYNRIIYSLVSSNDLPLVDIYRAFVNTCGGNSKCYLLNLPEGLHPNKIGYDVMGEMVSSIMLGFDILNSDGAVSYENFLNLAPGSLRTVSD